MLSKCYKIWILKNSNCMYEIDSSSNISINSLLCFDLNFDMCIINQVKQKCCSSVFKCKKKRSIESLLEIVILGWSRQSEDASEKKNNLNKCFYILSFVQCLICLDIRIYQFFMQKIIDPTCFLSWTWHFGWFG